MIFDRVKPLDAILAVAAKPSKNLGMIFLNSKKFAQKLLNLLESQKLLSAN